MEKLRAVVIGVGHLGKHHARIYKEMQDVELLGVLDISKEKADEIAALYDVQAFYSLEEVPENVQIASIVVPTKDHFVVADQLIGHGIHCLLEKPMTETLDEAKQLLDKVTNTGTILQVGHIERFNPAIKGLQKILKAPRFIECHRLCQYNPRGTDVSVVLDLMIHDLDIILYLVKSKITEIRAVGVPVIHRSDDIANCRIEFDNGCVANITASRVSHDNLRKIRIFQDDAYLSLDYFAQAGKLYKKEGMSIHVDNITFSKDEPLRLELRSFVDCVRDQKEPHVSGQDAYYALRIAHDVQKCIQKRNEKFQIIS